MPKKGGTYLMHGRHAVSAALSNPERIIRKVWVSPRLPEAELYISMAMQRHPRPTVVRAETPIRAGGRPGGHQDGAQRNGYALAAEVQPLPGAELEPILTQEHAIVLVLDHLTDTGNVGAILRSGLLLGVDAVIIPNDRSVRENASLAHSASGALEHIPMVPVVNLTRTVQRLQREGFWVIALDEQGEPFCVRSLGSESKIVFVIGREDRGLAPLLRSRCDQVVQLPQFTKTQSRQGLATQTHTGVALTSYNAATAAALAVMLVRAGRNLQGRQ